MTLLKLIAARLAAIPPNRLVLYATPVITALAGWLAELAARYLPGMPGLDAPHLLAVFVVGAGIAAVAIHKWLTGWQAHEAQITQAKIAVVTHKATDPLSALSNPDIHPDDAIPELDDLDSEKAKAAEKARVKAQE